MTILLRELNDASVEHWDVMSSGTTSYLKSRLIPSVFSPACRDVELFKVLGTESYLILGGSNRCLRQTCVIYKCIHARRIE